MRCLNPSGRSFIAQLDSLAIVYQSQLSQLDVGDNPWLQEIEDGLWVNAQRAAFMSALIRAVIDEDVTALSDAEAKYDAAAQRVTRRHERMWTKAPETMVTYGFNNTLYEFGYLTRADELCYWERERTQKSWRSQDKRVFLFPDVCSIELCRSNHDASTWLPVHLHPVGL